MTMSRIEFYKNCDKLLNVLPSRRIMEEAEIAVFLNVDDLYARAVAKRLRADGLASGSGWGPTSMNENTSTFRNFYKEKIEELKRERNKYRTALWTSWAAITISVVSLIVSILKWLY